MRKRFGILCLMLMLLLAGCGESGKSRAEQVEEQLQGTWSLLHEGSDRTVLEKWTFQDGTYTLDVYVNDVWLDNPRVGTYAIGAESIQTLTADQKNQVEGSFPYSFENGVLHLGDPELEKEKN